MKLGSLKSATSKDGVLCVVSRDLKTAVKVPHIVPSLREALENWDFFEPKLQQVFKDIQEGTAKDTFAVKLSDFHSCLPRTWLFADGSAFIHHIKLVRKARNAELPATLHTVPLMYQAESGRFLAHDEDIPQIDFSHGTDFEAEVGVLLKQTPMGVSSDSAVNNIALVTLINDVSLRGLIPEELAQGFGFFQSKPQKSLAPFAVTPDELGSAWQNARLHLPLHVKLNGEFFGKANAGEMHFHFGQLIAHAAKTRELAGATLIGSGTVANEDESVGSSCLAEKRTIETIKTGKPQTSFMKAGDLVEIEMFDSSGQSIFGRIAQKVRAVLN